MQKTGQAGSIKRQHSVFPGRKLDGEAQHPEQCGLAVPAGEETTPRGGPFKHVELASLKLCILCVRFILV